MIRPSLQTVPPPKSRTNHCGQFIKTSAAKAPWSKRLKPTGNIGPDRSAVALRSAYRKTKALSHNPHSTQSRPRFPPCQIYRRWSSR